MNAILGSEDLGVGGRVCCVGVLVGGCEGGERNGRASSNCLLLNLLREILLLLVKLRLRGVMTGGLCSQGGYLGQHRPTHY